MRDHHGQTLDDLPNLRRWFEAWAAGEAPGDPAVLDLAAAVAAAEGDPPRAADLARAALDALDAAGEDGGSWRADLDRRLATYRAGQAWTFTQR